MLMATKSMAAFTVRATIRHVITVGATNSFQTDARSDVP